VPESNAADKETVRRQLLERFPVFAELPAGRLEALLAEGQALRAPRGSVLFDAKQPCRGFPLLLEGSVRVLKAAPTGREILLYRVEPGQGCILSGGCLLGESDYSAAGIAEADIALLSIPPALFQELVLGFEPFRRFVFGMYGERLAEVMEVVEEVAFRRLDTRLAQLLIHRGPVIVATHQKLADDLGSVREIVSRLLCGERPARLCSTPSARQAAGVHVPDGAVNRFPLVADDRDHSGFSSLLLFFRSETLEQPFDALAHFGGGFLLAQRRQPVLQPPLEFHARETALARLKVVMHSLVLGLAQLPVDILKDLLERLLAIDLSFRHDTPPFLSCPEPDRTPVARAVAPHASSAWLDGPAPLIPWSRACCHSSFCSAPRARARRERTVPTGMSSISAISA
jgi:CRP/FNR family transcriptional regulator